MSLFRTSCLVTLAISLFAPTAFAYTCPEGIVSLGDTASDVLDRCGEPIFVDQRTDKVMVSVPEGPSFQKETLVEEWLYNPGPGSLIRIFVFHDGRLVSIQTGGRGVDPKDFKPSGRPPIVSNGDTKAQVLLKWGRPDETKQYEDYLGNEGDEDNEEEPVGRVVQRVLIDVWTYDFGPGRLVRNLIFANGKLIKNLSGSRSKASSH